MAYALTGLGLLLLIAGGELLVRGGVAISRLFGFSPLFVGLVILSIGTSSPEFAVTMHAALAGSSDIAIGNIVGSNITNILLVLGLGALIRPIETSPKAVLRDGGFMLIACVALVAMLWDGKLDRSDGALLVTGLGIFLLVSIVSDWRRTAAQSVFLSRARTREDGGLHPALSFLVLIVGVALLYFGSNLTVDGSLAIGRMFGYSDALMGLTVIALGTSLPEIVTTVIASLRGETGLAIGNVIGSVIFNILGVLGTTAMVRDITASTELTREDSIIMAGAAVLLVPLLNSGWRVCRWEGLLLVVCYGAYGVLLAYRAGFMPLAMLGL